ncbi:SHOCT domain-containing protein [Halomarina oriensis]|uniref:SHOCT domain-containing protein n=1 Tax=Halomarina oriensis TaxID=671145 RepID=A0A6B0GXF7_9EURY|nr:SHOCT domain-containing protein [Halomarina oriensis]MWG36458.1 hypothetical protein [Halomarina oriensis]
MPSDSPSPTDDGSESPTDDERTERASADTETLESTGRPAHAADGATASGDHESDTDPNADDGERIVRSSIENAPAHVREQAEPTSPSNPPESFLEGLDDDLRARIESEDNEVDQPSEVLREDTEYVGDAAAQQAGEESVAHESPDAHTNHETQALLDEHESPEAALSALRQQYVAGALSDEEFEAQFDALLGELKAAHSSGDLSDAEFEDHLDGMFDDTGDGEAADPPSGDASPDATDIPADREAHTSHETADAHTDRASQSDHGVSEAGDTPTATDDAPDLSVLEDAPPIAYSEVRGIRFRFSAEGADEDTAIDELQQDSQDLGERVFDENGRIDPEAADEDINEVMFRLVTQVLYPGHNPDGQDYPNIAREQWLGFHDTVKGQLFGAALQYLNDYVSGFTLTVDDSPPPGGRR